MKKKKIDKNKIRIGKIYFNHENNRYLCVESIYKSEDMFFNPVKRVRYYYLDNPDNIKFDPIDYANIVFSLVEKYETRSDQSR